MPAREVQSAYCPESFRGSPIIELSSPIERLDLEKLFGRNAPLHVDLGCGDGSFLCALALRMPERNFLGIERLVGRVRAAARKAATIGNVRLLRMESSYRSAICCRPHLWKHFTSCSPIRGQNGGIGACESLTIFFCVQLVRHWLAVERSASPLIVLTILTK